MSLYHYFILILLGSTWCRLNTFHPNGPQQQNRVFVDHPYPKGNKIHESIKAPHATNSWFQNFLLEEGEFPVNVMPLAFSFRASEIQISTSDPKRNIKEQSQVASVFVPDWSFQHNTPLKVVDYNEMSVSWGGNNIRVPIVQGMPFFTVELNNLQISFRTIAAIIGIHDSTQSYNPGQTTQPTNQVTVQLNSGMFWIFYSSQKVSISTDGSQLIFPSVNGYIRMGCLGENDITNDIVQFLPKYPTTAELDYSFTQSKYTLEYNYQTQGEGELMMMALPHHLDILQDTKTYPYTQSSIKGQMTAVIGDKWVLVDDLVSYTWNAPREIDPSKRETILQSLKVDANLEYPDPNDNDPYWMGLKLAKFARLALIADELGEDSIAQEIRGKMKSCLIPWLTGQSKDTLYYDRTYGGIISKWGMVDKNADYGNGYYNDHYFHYGYHLYVIATIVKKDLSFYSDYKNEILDLVSDVANPDWEDKYYTVARHKDWFNGHSWANGLFAFQDGRNQESTSEAMNCYYSIYLLGLAIQNQDMTNWGNMLLSMEMRSVKRYWHLPSTNTIYPENFRANKMVGMLWSFKADHLTWFGNQEIFVHAIQMIPFLPITELSLDQEFVKEQYPYMMRQGTLVEEWRVFEIMDHAIIDSQSAWTEATTYDKWSTTHAGQTKTNALWWISTRPTKNNVQTFMS